MAEGRSEDRRDVGEQRFDLLVEQVVDYAIFLLDNAGCVSTWNAGAKRIKGYLNSEIIGRHYRTFFSEEDRLNGKPERILDSARREGRFQEEGWRVRRDGTRFWASVVVTSMRDETGQLIGFAKITRDLTERLMADENARRLEEANRATREAAIADRQREQTRRRLSQLANLRTEVGAAAAQASEVGPLLDRSSHALVEHLGVDVGQIWLVSEPEETLQLFASRGQVVALAAPPATLALLPVVAAVRSGTSPVLWNDLSTSPFASDLEVAVAHGMTAFAACPMVGGAGTMGVVAVFSRSALPDDVGDALRSVADVLVHSIERCRAEGEVRQSREQLDLILRSISEGVTVQNTSGELVFVNDAAAILSGFDSAGQMLATPREGILARFEVLREDGTVLDPTHLPGRWALQGQVSQALLRFRNKRTGEERWSFVSGSPVFNPQGKVEFSVSIFREFTDRKRTEQAWQFLSDASAALASSLDHESTLAQVARLAVPRIADWCSVEILGPAGTLDPLVVAHVDPAKVALAMEWRRRWPPAPGSALYRVLETGVPNVVPEITREMIDGAIAEPAQRAAAYELGLRSAITVPLVVGQVPFGVLTFVSAGSGRRYDAQDLIMAIEIGRRAGLAVENARAYSEARAAVRIRDTFLSIASHELRTPLSSLTILTTSLLRAANQDRLMQLGPEGLRQRLITAERQTAQLTRLVDRLLDVTMLSAGDMPLDLSETDLTEVAREVVTGFEDVALSAGSVLELQADGPVRGVWDRSRVNQVVTNLVSNAIKYGGGGPVTVSVSVGSNGTEARIVVRDRGPGIKLEDQERIFSQFERAASPNVAGMGLGLWIARRIVESHRGAVTLESTPGLGAEFTVVLPRAELKGQAE